MNIAVLTRPNDPFSLMIYRKNLINELTHFGISCIPFQEKGPIPQQCDIVWDPGLAGNRIPPAIFDSAKKPLVVTVHGAAPLSMPWRDIYPSLGRAVRGKMRNIRTRMGWRSLRKQLSAFIVVSQFGAREVVSTFNLRREMIYPIYHGVDHDVFHAHGERYQRQKPFFLHVSSGVPKKNINRIIEAHRTLQKRDLFDLMLVLPGYRDAIGEQGITIVREGKSPIELAALYRGARGFIFPSLHETFGMPILEAMACGCPVVTSNGSACAEVSGDAALLVNQRSTHEIADAMQRIMLDESLRQLLRERGLARAQQFSWRKSAEEHLAVFKKVLGKI